MAIDGVPGLSMSSLDLEISELSGELLEKSEVVKGLRSSGSCDRDELVEKERELKEMNIRLRVLMKKRENGQAKEDGDEFNQEGTSSLLKRRFFVTPSFEIYGGVAGFYDFGPPGCAVKTNVIQMWRHHFVVQESMMELEGTCLTPEAVLKASGHVDRFSDLLVNDTVTGKGYRADHLLEDRLKKVIGDPAVTAEMREEAESLHAQVDSLSAAELDSAIQKWDVKATDTGNDVSPAFPFNLMFSSLIGPAGLIQGYLRPETAQGIFVNFKRLLDFAGSRLPFACAQVGLAFRNEIDPRHGLLRVREFQQAEIEHFVHPDHKEHPKYDLVKDYLVTLYPEREQLSTRIPVQMTIQKAVENKIIDNETLAYFIARTSMFAEKIGLKRKYLRFRQHQQLEMAHYAQECWDLEVKCSYGWVECVGLADRSCFDLKNHSEHSNVELVAREVFAEVQSVKYLLVVPNKGVLGKAFKKDAQKIMKVMSEWSEEEAEKKYAEFEGGAEAIIVEVEGGQEFEVTKNMVNFEQATKKVSGRNYYPSVIEPSFGIGRLLHCVFEHNFYVREGDDEARGVLGFPPTVAPIKTAVLPLQKNEVFTPILAEVGHALGEAGLIYRIDDTGASIGKRYSRFDELGTPFGITVDFDSVTDRSVTLRERDTMHQVRGDITSIVDAIQMMVLAKMTWSEVAANFPAFTAAAE